MASTLAHWVVLTCTSPVVHPQSGADGRGLELQTDPLTDEQCSSAGFERAESAGLFVGVRTFLDAGIHEVPYAVDDAVDLAYAFAIQLELIAPERVLLAVSGEPQKPDSRRRLEELKEARAALCDAKYVRLIEVVEKVTRSAGKRGLVVISLATHGYQWKENDGRLFAEDSLPSAWERTTVPVGLVTDAISASPAPRQILLLDACREKVQQSRSQQDSRSGLSVDLEDAISKARGLSILYAAKSGGYSFDDPQARNGVFTSAFLRALQEGGAKADENGLVTLDAIAEFANAEVERWVEESGRDSSAKKGISYYKDVSTQPLPLAVSRQAVASADRELRERLLGVLRNHIERGGITGSMFDGIAKHLRSDAAQEVAPLIERLMKLEQRGADDAEDFALWWAFKGRPALEEGEDGGARAHTGSGAEKTRKTRLVIRLSGRDGLPVSDREAWVVPARHEGRHLFEPCDRTEALAGWTNAEGECDLELPDPTPAAIWIGPAPPSCLMVAGSAEGELLPLAERLVLTPQGGQPLYAAVVCEPASRIRGRIVDESGRPVSRTIVRAKAEDSDAELLVLSSEEGAFDLEPVGGGSYVIEAIGPGEGTIEAATRVKVGPDRAEVVVRLTLPSTNDRVLTASGNLATLWETGRERPLRDFRGHQDIVRAVAFSPDGRRVLTGSQDGTAFVRDSDTGEQVSTLSRAGGPVRTVAFCLDGKRVLTGCEDQTAHAWDAESGAHLVAFKEHTGPVYSVAFSPDGARVLTGSWDRSARLWDSRTGQRSQVLRGHSHSVEAVAFSPDGKLVLTGSRDQTAILWDAESGKHLKTLSANSGAIWSVAFSPDGKHVLTGGYDGIVRLWSIDASGLDSLEGREPQAFEKHGGAVMSLAFSRDGKRVLSGSLDHTARLWDAQGRRLLWEFAHEAPVLATAFSPEGTADGAVAARTLSPRARADMLARMASNLLRTGGDPEDYGESVELASSALEIQLGSAEAPCRTMTSRYTLARALLAAGRLAEAEASYRSLFEDCRTLFGDSSEEQAWVLGELGILVDLEGRREEAEELWMDALRILEARGEHVGQRSRHLESQIAERRSR